VKLGKQLEAANDRSTTFICIVDAESLNGKVQLKNSLTRESKLVPIDRIFEFLPAENWSTQPLIDQPPA
jgi:histidyl-tRNA synthetase